MELYIEFFNQQLILFMGLAAIIGFLIHSYVNDRFNGFSKISPINSVKLINKDAKIIDVRTQQDFDKNHIKDSMNIPAMDVVEKLKKKSSSKQENLILVCNNGLQSGSVAKKLKKEGYKHLYLMEGGIASWQDAKLPVFSKQEKQTKKSKQSQKK